MKSDSLIETRWIVDRIHSEIGFKVKHLMIASVKGSFRHFDAQVCTRGTDFTQVDVDLTIQSDSIDTGDRERDEHLMSPDFLDVSNFDQIRFKSSKSTRLRTKDERVLHGDLTILGITRPVQMKVRFGGILQDPWGNEKAGFQVVGLINRQDWGLTWNKALESGGFLIGESVMINCEFELINATRRALVREEEFLLWPN